MGQLVIDYFYMMNEYYHNFDHYVVYIVDCNKFLLELYYYEN